ncbi:terpenoid synthase [Moniliophthora roreri]|nr:terpenoid synthase [Moniliophthora roreri]
MTFDCCDFNIVMDAIRNLHKPRPSGEWVVRQFWADAKRTATLPAQRRFIDTSQLHADSVVEQALDHEDHHIDSVKTYFHVRRDTIGAKPSFAINEIHMNLSDKGMEHPIIKTLTWTALSTC